jgi:hypothetical protein
MNRVGVVGLFALSTSMIAQTSYVRSGSTVYIEPMNGQETYLAAALVKKHVPLVVVADKGKADYVITISQQTPSQPLVVLNQNPWAGSTSMSISMRGSNDSRIVFAYTVSMRGDDRIQSAAESCAKHLNEFIEKSEREKK